MPPVEVRVPNIGDFSDVPIIDVMVAPGDSVAVEDPLVTLESDKATMEVPSSRAGTVKTIAVKVGDKVSEGSVLITLDAPPDSAAEGSAQASPVSAPPPEPASGNGASHSPSAGATDRRSDAPRTVAQEPASYGAHPAEPTQATDQPPAVHSETMGSENGVVHASPSIRRFARELGVSLADVQPSGPHERITREDVQKFVKAALASPARSAGPGLPFDLAPLQKVDFAKYGPIEPVALSRIRKISGSALHRNWVSIPHVTNNDEADVTELEAFRKRINAERNVKTTLLAFAMKAVAAALAAYPDVNASLDGDTLIRKRYYNIGFAADTPAGLVVPVLRDADRKGVIEIAQQTAELAAKARDGKLSAADMSGATFTISSLGGIGGTSFTPIVNAPEVAILGLSRTALRPIWDGDAFVPRLMLPLSLSYDHRVIDGALAARFNAHLAASLGDVRRLLL